MGRRQRRPPLAANQTLPSFERGPPPFWPRLSSAVCAFLGQGSPRRPICPSEKPRRRRRSSSSSSSSGSSGSSSGSAAAAAAAAAGRQADLGEAAAASRVGGGRPRARGFSGGTPGDPSGRPLRGGLSARRREAGRARPRTACTRRRSHVAVLTAGARRHRAYFRHRPCSPYVCASLSARGDLAQNPLCTPPAVASPVVSAPAHHANCVDRCMVGPETQPWQPGPGHGA